MAALLTLEATLTDKYQATVPKAVRKALKLGKRDKIGYSIRPGGEVVLTRVVPGEGADPALAPFLSLLAEDMAKNPHRLQLVDGALADRLRGLVAGVEVDLDAPLSADDE